MISQIFLDIILITLPIFFFYYPTFNFSLIVDDIATYKNILNNPKNFELKSNIEKNGILRGAIRFIGQRFYGFGLTGTNIVREHMVTTALFSTCCALIYLTFGANIISLWAAILFAFHPANNQISIWCNGRRYLLSIILVLLMIAFKPWGILFYFPTMIFQVTAIFSPILMGHPIYWIAIPIALALGYKQMAKRVANRKKIILDEDRLKFTAKRSFIIIKQYGHYFFKMLFPSRCAMTYPTLHFWGVTQSGNKDAYSFNKDFFVGFLALSLTLLWFIFPMGFPREYIVFAFLSVIQWCAVMPYVQDLADRYCNMANVFIVLALSHIAHNYFGVLALPFLVGITVYYMVWTRMIFPMYKNISGYWEYHRYHFPKIIIPLKFQISDLLKAGDMLQAAYLCREGLRYNPTDFTLLYQMAVYHKAIGEKDVAYEYAVKASENYYIDQKPFHQERLEYLIESVKPEKKSRQVSRQEKRKENDKDR